MRRRYGRGCSHHWVGDLRQPVVPLRFPCLLKSFDHRTDCVPRCRPVGERVRIGEEIDAVSNILKWVLLLVAIGTFAGLAWATWETYRAAPPQPDHYVTTDGRVVMSGADVIAGKSGFQRADLMDYGSLYGMGSYFGEDYTAPIWWPWPT